MLKISSSTKLYMVIGDPIGHSLSPIMHNLAFQRLGLNNVYLAFRIKSKDLASTITGLKALGISGFNVTIPHKVSVIQYLDRIEDRAAAIGAVNTVVNKDGILEGYNTDGTGALTALSEGVQLENRKIILLGAGGAARALAFSIALKTKKFVILDRTASKAKNLANSVSEHIGFDIQWEELTQGNIRYEIKDADILINATSVGMYPKVDESIVEKKYLHPKLTVFDIVYNPITTRLLKEAEEIGAHIISGVKMLVYQGALAFELWTGKKPPIDEMQLAVEKILKEN